MDEDMQFDSGATAFSALHQYPHIQPANGSGDKKMLCVHIHIRRESNFD